MAENRPLTREVILAKRSLKQETVDVPEWGGAVIVQELTGAERDAFEASCVQKRGKRSYDTNFANLRAKLVVQTVRSVDGSRLFADADTDAVGQLSAAALNRLFEVAQQLSGMTNEDVEELAGNSRGGPSGSSPTGSPTVSASPTSMDSSQD
jgi:hypothetical protein